MGEHVRSVFRERRGRLWRVGLMALLAAIVLGLGASAPTFAAEESEEACQPSVIGGTALPDGKYPFVVALLDKRNGSSAY